MRLKGEDTASALVEWVKTDIKEIGKYSFDLGKFAFTVSSGSIGLLATLQKLDSNFALTGCNAVPHVVFAISLVLSFVLILPRNKIVDGDTDLLKLYEREVAFVAIRIGIWFALWAVGVILAFLVMARS